MATAYLALLFATISASLLISAVIVGVISFVYLRYMETDEHPLVEIAERLKKVLWGVFCSLVLLYIAQLGSEILSPHGGWMTSVMRGTARIVVNGWFVTVILPCCVATYLGCRLGGWLACRMFRTRELKFMPWEFICFSWRRV